jgi:hypothetical protein
MIAVRGRFPILSPTTLRDKLADRARWQCVSVLPDRDQRFRGTLPNQHHILSWDFNIGTNGKDGSAAGSSEVLCVVSPVWQRPVMRGGETSLKRAF